MTGLTPIECEIVEHMELRHLLIKWRKYIEGPQAKSDKFLQQKSGCVGQYLNNIINISRMILDL